MIKFGVLFLCICLGPSLLFAANSAPITSLYTNLSGSQCKLLKSDKETGSSICQCPGVGGYGLFVLDDDGRMSVTVIAPNKKEYPLNFWDVITGSFLRLAEKAEWRVINENGKSKPIALIVRVIATDQSDPASPKQVQYLAVAKITPNEICVTAKIGPVKNANELARAAADKSAGQPCLEPLGEGQAKAAQSFGEFWGSFRQAVLAGDKEKVASMTRFPFETRGPLDDDPVRTYDKKAFLSIFQRLLMQDTGMKKTAEPMRDLIDHTKGVPEKNGNETQRVGNFVFQKVNGKWMFTMAYLD